jgi:hypothetical protein
MAPRSKRDTGQTADPDMGQNGHDKDVARYEEELVGVLTERIKPGLNRGAIPLLARSIAKEIAHREHPRDASQEAEDEEERGAEEDEERGAEDDEERDPEASEESEADDEDSDESESSPDLMGHLRDLQGKLGSDWILYFSVRDGEAWLTAEKEDASQRIEAPSASVLVKAVKLLNESGGRSAKRAAA